VLVTHVSQEAEGTPPPRARARDILLLVARGLDNNEIAGRLVISPFTAKIHVRNILPKLGCHDRAGLVAIAYETGLITPGDAD